jgi:hypothetical protein
MQQKIGLAGCDVACDHFGQLRHGLYKCVRVGIVVTFNIHANKRDYAQADFFAIEARSVTFNETVFLKLANPAQWLGFTTTYKTAGTAKLRGSRTSLANCGLGCGLDKVDWTSQPSFPGTRFLGRVGIRNRTPLPTGTNS